MLTLFSDTKLDVEFIFRDCCCTKGNVEDKILVPKPPKNYARCGHPINGPYYQGCALLRKKLEEDLAYQRCTRTRCGSGLSKGLCLICGNNQNSLNDSPSISKNSPQNPPHIDERCYECGDALDGIFCQRCTSNLVDESPNVFNPPPQPPIYSCEFCKSNAQYGHYCTPQVLFICPEPDEVIKSSVEDLVPIPSEFEGILDTMCDVHLVNNPTPLEAKAHFEIVLNSNDDYSSSDDDSLYYENIEYVEASPHDSELVSLECQTMNQNFYNSDSPGFNQTQPPQFPVIHPPPKETSIEILHDQENNRHAFYDDDDDDVDYTIAITPVLSTKEPDNSLSMGDEHLDTISATESDEVIKSSVEDLLPIPSEFEGIPDTMCDVHLVNNPTPLEAKAHFEIVINSNDDYSSSDDESLYYENIEYVEASTHDSELVSLEVAKIVIPEDEEIEDDNFTNTFDSSLPEFENFCFDLEEISSDSTTTHSDISLLDYEAFSFYDDHIEEISSGSTATHSDISLFEYDSFIFDLSNDQFPPIDRSDSTHEEFADELATSYLHRSMIVSTLGICPIQVKLSDLKQALRRRHPMLIRSILGNLKTLVKGFCTQVFISSS
nr:hypothetical protein [Tanacetum cinerariifolium]